MEYVENLTNLLVSSTFQRLLQISGSDSVVLDGTGSEASLKINGDITASSYYGDGSNLTGVISSSYATSASYAVSASYEIIKEVSSSHADTASFAQSGDGVFSGSFSGSYYGDGSNLTVNGVDILTTSQSVSTRLTTNEFDIDTLETASASFASDIDTLETASSSFASDIIDLQSDSASFASDIIDLQSDSASFSTRVTNEETTSSALINDYDYVQSLGTNDDVIFNSISASNMTLSTILISGSYDLTQNYYYVDIDTTTYSCSIQFFDASDVVNG